MNKLTRVLLIGGPGSGKTTLIKAIEKNGYPVFHEISRAVTQQAQEQGIDQLFLSDPLAFSNELLKGRIQQFEQPTNGLNFYDRGIPDVPAYHHFTNDPIPQAYLYAVDTYRYDHVFFLPPWKEIYESDNERYETYKQAQEISQILLEFYQKHQYNPQEVPTGPVENRLDFILSQFQSD